MNINNLKTVFDNKSDYYLVQKDENVVLCFIEYESEAENFEDLSIKELLALESQPLDKNVYLNSDYPPFQLGLSLSGIDNIYSLRQIEKEVMEELKIDPKDVTIPFIGGINFNHRAMLIKWLGFDKKRAWEYAEFFREEVKNHLEKRMEVKKNG